MKDLQSMVWKLLVESWAALCYTLVDKFFQGVYGAFERIRLWRGRWCGAQGRVCEVMEVRRPRHDCTSSANHEDQDEEETQ